MKPPCISVIIPTCRRDAFLRRAIESVLAQDVPGTEVIVADDASLESTRILCSGYRVTYVSQQGRGPSASRNLGVLKASGELLAFLDDDDLWPEGSLRARLNRWMEDASDRLVVGKVRRFMEDEDGTLSFLDSEETARHLLVLGSTVMPRSSYLAVGGMDESLRMHEDTDLWIRMRANGTRIDYIPEICLHYRRHDGNVTSDRRYTLAQTEVLRRHLLRKKSLAGEEIKVSGISSNSPTTS